MATIIHKPRDTRAGDIGAGLGEGLKSFVGSAVEADKDAKNKQFLLEQLLAKQKFQEEMQNKEQKFREELQASTQAHAQRMQEDRQLAADTRHDIEMVQRQNLATQEQQFRKGLTKQQQEFESTQQAAQNTFASMQNIAKSHMDYLIEEMKLKNQLNIKMSERLSPADSAKLSVQRMKFIGGLTTEIARMYEYDAPEELIESFMQQVQSLAEQAGVSTEQIGLALGKRSSGLAAWWNKLSKKLFKFNKAIGAIHPEERFEGEPDEDRGGIRWDAQ